jgi:poly(3-hydroxyoctanoate) depolymerase
LNGSWRSGWHISKNSAKLGHNKKVTALANDGARRPLVILPGVNSGLYLFAGCEALLEREVIFFDTPGVGKEPLPLPFSPLAYAGQVLAELDRRKVKQFDLLGHSMGGFAAQELVRLVPERVRRLVLVSTGCGQPFTARDIMHLAKVTGRSYWQFQKEMEERPRETVRVIFGKGFAEQRPDIYGKFLKDNAAYKPGWSVTMAHVTAGGMFSSTGWVKSVRTPTLVIHGTDDPLVTVMSGRELARRLPNGRMMELLGVGHFPMLEHDRFYAYVQRFLDGEELVGTPPGEAEKAWWQRLGHRLWR